MATFTPTFLVDLDERDLAKLRELLGEKRFRQAVFQAVNRTTTKVRTKIRAEVKKRSFIKAKYISEAVTSKVSRGDVPLGLVRVTRQMLPAIAFKTRASKRQGVTILTGPGRPAIVLRHAFKARVRGNNPEANENGHEGIFLRAKHLPKKGKNKNKGKLTRRGFAGRLAIIQQYGPPAISVVDVPDVIASIRFDAEAEMSTQLRNQLSRFGFSDVVLPSDLANV